MSDISELETRITTALERINAGLDKWADRPAAVTDEVDQLTRQLEDERTANAQLSERLSALKTQITDKVATVEVEVARLHDQLAQSEATADTLRKSNQELRSANDALRQAANSGVVEAELINDAMVAELSALKATQQADRAELEVVLTELAAMTAAQTTNVSEEDTHA
ncbi:hypothetical protein ALP8811_00802 [Aliiroseovarius pelagivivens]|uniref:Chromosome partition protein Smc n=1 Tax=Aliiroseovarius pelagivivens TaxID=1639690 RepID=A0A2R8AIG1_9RHOB|nr:hypothetical protein [Aliiroseovarius pelagivivens]SPF75808.1 hypothetical protein ALP8811_00802 [Aliiroseovarius pelagivivens]